MPERKRASSCDIFPYEERKKQTKKLGLCLNALKIRKMTTQIMQGKASEERVWCQWVLVQLMDTNQSCSWQNTRGGVHKFMYLADKMVTIGMVQWWWWSRWWLYLFKGLTWYIVIKKCHLKVPPGKLFVDYPHGVSLTSNNIFVVIFTQPKRFMLRRFCMLKNDDRLGPLYVKRSMTYWEHEINNQDWIRSEFVQTTQCQRVSSGFDPGSVGELPLKLFTPSSSLILA